MWKVIAGVNSYKFNSNSDFALAIINGLDLNLKFTNLNKQQEPTIQSNSSKLNTKLTITLVSAFIDISLNSAISILSQDGAMLNATYDCLLAKIDLSKDTVIWKSVILGFCILSLVK
ncbi:hypothetical protein Glove_60g142 [Diversispora epigaea]|uniref:Uncharacterized protein n=1 Tax=Diversispora epigaea TaxID=1348612 RepID=A0A397JCI5_9GLOM|nr:hypothetical protein Glove_60g142 [Diversispora epigaea]